MKKVSRLPALDPAGKKCFVIRSAPDLTRSLIGPDPETEEQDATYVIENGEKLNRTSHPDKFTTKDGRIYTLT